MPRASCRSARSADSPSGPSRGRPRSSGKKRGVERRQGPRRASSAASSCRRCPCTAAAGAPPTCLPASSHFASMARPRGVRVQPRRQTLGIDRVSYAREGRCTPVLVEVALNGAAEARHEFLQKLCPQPYLRSSPTASARAPAVHDLVANHVEIPEQLVHRPGDILGKASPYGGVQPIYGRLGSDPESRFPVFSGPHIRILIPCFQNDACAWRSSRSVAIRCLCLIRRFCRPLASWRATRR